MNDSKELLKNTGAAVAGAAVGTSAGLAGSAAAISTAGAVTGLSGAGITSGLASIGGSVLGGAAILTCGVAVLAVGGAFGATILMKQISEKRAREVVGE
jgi:hypothetical protein